uniref:UDP-N-acetylmuramoylalanine--D-glutamate ligase n=1 Tax=Tetraselmis sp. GSL018 TaxID=582737 RepID=A0A061QTM9_9CHLO
MVFPSKLVDLKADTFLLRELLKPCSRNALPTSALFYKRSGKYVSLGFGVHARSCPTKPRQKRFRYVDFRIASGIDRDKDLESENVVVLGLGVSGRAAAELALYRGAYVTGLDDNSKLDLTSWSVPHRFERFSVSLGSDQDSVLANATQLVVSPGVSLQSRAVKRALSMGIPVVSELGFGFQAIPRDSRCAIAAITGTNGKSTVTHFLAQLLRSAGVTAWAGGNLGTPISALSLGMRTGRLSGVQAAVLEVSSFQLEAPSAFRPDAAAVLNLTPDHLERHGSMAAYAAAKCSVFRNMAPGAPAFLPGDDHALTEMALDANPSLSVLGIGRLPGVQLMGRHAAVSIPGLPEFELDLRPLRCSGTHNLVNAAVAAAMAASLRLPGAGPSQLQGGLGRLEMLPHRMQSLGTTHDVEWIDDSKATNVEAAATGIQGLEKPAVVLLGGRAKRLAEGGLGFWRVAGALSCHRAAVAFGEDAPGIAEELCDAGVACILADDLEEAVRVACGLALPGDAILLSPGCSSFDEFVSFEHRGRAFAALKHAYSTEGRSC